MMETDDLWPLIRGKMTFDCISHFKLQFIFCVCLGKDRFAEGASNEPPLWGFFHDKDDFIRCIHPSIITRNAYKNNDFDKVV